MKVKVLQSNLQDALNKAGLAVSQVSTMELLKNVQFYLEDGRMRLGATDLRTGMVLDVPAVIDGEEVSFSAPARLLAEFVKELPDEQINIEVEQTAIRLMCDPHVGRIKTIAGEEFPELKTVSAIEGKPGHVSWDLDFRGLKQLIDQVAFSAATDESRPILTGVLVRMVEDHLVFAAADGFRLAVSKASGVGTQVSEPTDLIVPASAFKVVSRVFDEDGQVELHIDATRNYLLFAGERTQVATQLIDGNFPDYTQIVPKRHDTRAVVSREELLKALKVSFIFARGGSNIVQFHVTPGDDGIGGKVDLRGASGELGDNLSDVDATVEGPGIEIAFNARYAIQALDAIATPDVALEFTVPSAPGVFRPVPDDAKDYVLVIMPMHITKA